MIERRERSELTYVQRVQMAYAAIVLWKAAKYLSGDEDAEINFDEDGAAALITTAEDLIAYSFSYDIKDTDAEEI